MTYYRIGLATLTLIIFGGCGGQSDVSPERRNKELARQFFQDIDNSGGSLDFIDKWMTDGFQSRLNSADAMDKEGYRQFMAGAFAGFPKIQHEIHYMVAEDDLVALGITLHMEHTGEFMGIPPTGTNAAVEEIIVMRFENEMIVEEWGVFDMAGLLQQIGTPTATE